MNDIKKDLAEFFVSDSKDYLLRFNQLEENATHIGTRSKLVVELMFSLECALKALFIYETNLDAKESYKKIKKFSHDIKKLVDNLTEDSRNEFNRIITIDYDNYKVFHRYMFESEMAFREEFGILGEKYYSTINNFQWRREFRNQIKSFIDYVETKFPFEFRIQSFSEIDIYEEMSKYNALKEILN